MTSETREAVARVIDPALELGGATAREAYAKADLILALLPQTPAAGSGWSDADVERMARAHRVERERQGFAIGSWEDLRDVERTDCLTAMRAALSAIGAPSEGGGWVLVPEEPDEGQVRQARRQTGIKSALLRACYRAMIAAAPSPRSGEDEGAD